MKNKNRENRLRRVARRQGFRLMKSRHREVRAAEFGMFWIIDGDLNCVVAGGQFGMSLDDAQLWLEMQVGR